MSTVSAELILDMSQALAEVDQLAADIDSVTQDVTVSLDVESSVDEVQAELDALEAAPVDVEVDADVSGAEAEITSLDADPVEVPVEADTTQAEEAIQGLGEQSQETLGSLGGLEGGLGGLGGAAGALTGDFSGLSGAVGGFGATAGLAAGSAVAVAGAFSEFAAAGAEAISVEQRFAAATGSLGDEIRNIDVAGINADLGDLAISLGGSDEAALAAATNLALIGEQAGLSESEIDTFTEGLFAFEAAAIASGLASGSLGDNTQRLASGFARGGRFLQNFGVSLTSAEIAQQALLETGKATASELTQIEKAQAGLNLALQQNPDLAAQVAAGQQNIATQTAAARARFGELIEEVGRPLAPTVAELSSTLTEVATVAAPAVGAAFEDLNAVLGLTADAASGITAVSDAFSDLTAEIPGASEEFDLLGAAIESSVDLLLSSIPGLQQLSDFLDLGDLGGEQLDKTASAASELGKTSDEAAAGMEQAAAASAALQSSLPSLSDSFDDVLGKAPGLAEEFNILNAESNPGILSANLQAQADALNAWAVDLDVVANEGPAGLADALRGLGPEAAGLTAEIANALRNGDVVEAARLAGAISNLEDAQANITGLGTETGAGFSEAAQSAISTGGEAVGAAADAAGNAAAQGLSTGYAVAVALIQVQMALVVATVAVGGVQLSATAGLAGSTAGTALSRGFSNTSRSQISAAMSGVSLAIVGASGSVAAQAGSAGYNIGSALGSGIRRGIQQSTSDIAAAAANAVNAAEAAARAAADIASPSKKFMYLGEQMGEGLVLGFEQAVAPLVGAASDVTLNAVGAAGMNVGGVQINVSQAITADAGQYREMRQASRSGVEVGARELVSTLFDVGRA